MHKPARKKTTKTEKTWQIENLELRQLMSVSPSYEEFFLSTENSDGAYVQLSNESEFKAEFTMRFNGNISVNLQDLVQQIRNEPIPGDDGSIPDYEKAYYYLMKNHAHDFPLSGRTWMHEPSLYLNSLGAGLCDDAASALSLIWNAMGYESRVWLLSGHVVSEVHTGERWQLYDADLKVHYYNREGKVAGLEELAAQPGLITNPTQPVSTDAYAYRGRISQIYSSVDDNSLCTACDAHTIGRDLVFQIPVGGTLEWGQETVDRTLPLIHLDTATKLGLIKVTIPANSTGTLDIPLAIYDVRGSAGDNVNVAGETLALATDAAFEFFNEDIIVGNRIHTIIYEENAEPIEVLYFFNQQFAAVQNNNSIEIEHRTAKAAELTATLEGPITSWNFGTDNAGTPDGVSFSGTEYVDGSGNQATALFNGKKAFEINARIQLASATGPRRPVVDAYRFSVEIDEQNRPYVYYRAENDKWVGLRGQPLSGNDWHDLNVTYDQGTISLFVNGHLAGSSSGPPIDSKYPTYQLLIGKSEHLGGLYFEGKIENVTISEVNDDKLTPKSQHLQVLEPDSGNEADNVRGEAVYGPFTVDTPIIATPATTPLEQFASLRRKRAR